MTYQDFQILVDKSNNIRVSSSQGEISSKLCWENNEIELALQLIDSEKTNSKLLKALGRKLYQALFPDKINARFHATQANKYRVRLRLVFESPQLAALPWEFLYDEDKNIFLANNTETVLSRYIDVPLQKRDIKAASLPLKILLVISNATDLNPLDANGEEELIREALGKHIEAGQIELDVLKSATTRNIRQKLREKPYNVFHFIGHGDFDSQKGYIYLVDEDSKSKPLDDETFANFFLGNKNLGLVILNSCQSGTVASNQPFAGIAPNLVRRGIPAVVAMQYSIVDSTAKLFADEFYRILALEYPVDAAIQATRNAISMEVGLDKRDFAAPVLYMRAKDGIILKDIKQKEESRTKSSQETLKLDIEETEQSRTKPFQAPPIPEYYVDRPEVTKDLKERLLADGGTLVITAIHGLGSVGKSTVAAALAHDAKIKNHFGDGILWATLGQEPDVLSLLGGWVQGLGDYNYRATNIKATSAYLNTLLSQKKVLLVVDDAWIDKNKGWKHVEAFKVGGSRCGMLVTTRDSSVASSLNASPYYLDVMNETQSLDLLRKKAKQLGKPLETSEIKLAKDLAKAVGYLPLALELAAAQVASGTPWQVLIKDIKQEIARLKSFQEPGIRYVNDDEEFKKLSLRASLNLSVKRLAENDRNCFVWLGVLPEDASITPKMTATLWDDEQRDAEDTLKYLRSKALLLPGVSLADGTVTYRLHDLFHDFARNLLIAPQQPKRQGDLVGLGMKWEDVHARFLDKYQQQTQNNLWHTLDDDGYIHQHLVWHLEKAGKVEEIHQLLREDSASGNNGWYEVRERFGQTAGFLTDVAKAWELAETDWENKNLSQVVGLQCRYGLIIASLNSLAANIAAELIVVFVKNKFWYPEQGLAYVLQKPNPNDKAKSLILLADYLPDALKQQALETALDATFQINSEDKDERPQVFSSLVPKLPENLDKKALKNVHKKIKNRYHLARFIITLGEKLQDENLYKEALEIARLINDEYYLANVLSSLAQNLPENLYKEALEIARQINDKSHRAEVISSLAQKFQNENLYKQALEIARQINDEPHRAEVISSLAQKFQNENLYKQALRIARQIEDEYDRDNVLSSLAQKLPENLYNEALEIARQINDEFHRAEVISSLAQKLQDENLYKEALEIARQINDESHRAEVISSLAQKLQDENLYKEVLEIARQIENEYDRMEALSSLVQNFQDENLYKEVLEIARQIENEYYRANVLFSLVQNFQDENLYKEVLEIARQIENEYDRMEALSSLVQNFQDENLYKEVLENARQIEDEYDRMEVLSSLAQKLQDENLYHEALEIARQIEDEYLRANVLSCLAEKLQDENLYKEALEIARQIEDEYLRAKVLSSLAQNLPQNLYKEALEIARQIKDESRRANVLSSLAQNLPQNLYKEVLEIARLIYDEYYRANVLSSLPQNLPEDLYKQALEIARLIYDEYYRANVLFSLAQKLQDENLYHEALEIVRLIKREDYRANVLSSLPQNLPENLYKQALEIARLIYDEYNCANVLFSLAQKLQDENLYHEALEIARLIKYEYYRAEFLSSLPQNLPENLYNEALKIARLIYDECYRANVLSSLAQNLPENFYKQALENAGQIEDEYDRANFLSSLTQELPENLYEQILKIARKMESRNCAKVLSSLAQNLPENLYQEKLKIAREIKFELYRKKVLSSLTQNLPENVYDEALEIASEIKSESHRINVLSDLANVISPKKFQNKVFSMWSELLENLSKNDRKKFQENTSKLTPVIFYLGDKEAIMELASAIQDVARWWR